MKKFRLTLGLLLITGFVSAQLPTQTSGRDQDTQMQPESDEVEEPASFNEPEDKTKESEVDSTDEDSVSKYNFLFYFLYQKKYQQDL